MAKRDAKQVSIRKPVYVFGGVVLGIAVLGFALVTFTGGGGPGDTPSQTAAPQATPAVTAPSSPSAVAENPPAEGLRPGGRDPFQALVASSGGGGSAPAASPAPSEAPNTTDSRYVALVKAGKCQALPPNEPHTLEEVIAHHDECLAANPE